MTTSEQGRLVVDGQQGFRRVPAVLLAKQALKLITLDNCPMAVGADE